MKAYRIAKPHYRAGVYYPADSVVRIPDDEKPSCTWTEIKDAAPAASAPAKEPPKKGGRPSDSSPI